MQHIVNDNIEANVDAARTRIAEACRRSGRTAGDVRIVAATKYVDAATIARLLECGVVDIGENRLDALVAKQAALGGEPGQQAGPVSRAKPHWHYIGRLQSRKAAEVAARVGLIETLCTTSAAERLARHAREGGVLPDLLVQVNVDGDPGKDGVAPDDLQGFLEMLDPAVRERVRGLMTMPALAPDPQASRGAFCRLRELRDTVAGRLAGAVSLPELSMGTSQDFEVAVEEGATLVRLGTVLYASV